MRLKRGCAITTFTILIVFLLGFGYVEYPLMAARVKWGPYLQLCDDVYSGNISGVKRDLAGGVDPNKLPDDDEAIGDEMDMAALCVAASRGNLAIANLLLDHGADPNIVDGWHGSPLTAAAEADNVPMLELLVKRGAKINESTDGSWALWRSATGGKLKAERYLLENGANPNTSAYTTKVGERVLEATRLSGQPAATALLKKFGARE
ncbi:MAG TPA: ankyrin repeat domain-containing protein [Capsulimonadaceae bacterium]|jgi:ankyrin repeat protein